MMDAVRARLASFVRLPPVPAAPAVRVIERQNADGYSRSLLQYLAPDGDSIEAFLFEPADTVCRGGVLALHQHNSQWTIGKSEIAGLAGDRLQAFGPALARCGVAVLAPDAIGFESRLRPAGSGASLAPRLTRAGGSADGWLQYYNQMGHRLVQGDLLMRKMVVDCMTAVSLLPEIDKCQGIPVGAMGHSLGGIVALFLAALDTRIAFTCTSGAVGSYRYKLAHGNGLEMSLVIPGFANEFDVDDLLRCVVPRRLFVISSDEDPATADADELVLQARAVFEAQHCAEHLRHLRVSGPHALDQQRFDAIVDWTVAQFQKAG